jgi:hypothetical protein
MDERQTWYGHFLTLGDAQKYLKSVGDEISKNTKLHELYVTFLLASFLSYRDNRHYLIGFPSLTGVKDFGINEFLQTDSALDSENFDTVIADSENLKRPIKFQIKRYVNAKTPSTLDLFSFICDKVDKYGDAPELNVAFHIQDNIALDVNRFAGLVKAKYFHVGSVLLVGEFIEFPGTFVLEAFPNYTGKFWHTSFRNDSGQ